MAMAFSRRDFIMTGAGAACAVATSGAQVLQNNGVQNTPPQDNKEAKPVEPGKTLPLDRMPEIPVDKMTDAQKKAAEEFAAGRGTPVFGPFIPMLRSPEVMLRAKAMGDYLRYKNSLPPKISEFAILITARHWSQQYEWAVHFPIAFNAGLGSEMLKTVAEGRFPKGLYESEQLCYEFCIELLNNQCVSDETYSWAVSKWGEHGVIDLVGVCGYYTFLAMIMNVARTALPKGTQPPLQNYPH
jgi:4-carboxymuconolactone decarboxylase